MMFVLGQDTEPRYVDADLACNTLQLEAERGRATVGDMRLLADGAMQSLAAYRRAYATSQDPERRELVREAAAAWEEIVAILASTLQKDSAPLKPATTVRLCPWIEQAGELMRGETVGQPLQRAATTILERYHGRPPALRPTRVGLSTAGKVVVGALAAALLATGALAIYEWRKE